MKFCHKTLLNNVYRSLEMKMYKHCRKQVLCEIVANNSKEVFNKNPKSPQ